MADLLFSAAERLAESLITMGHPYSRVAIRATATDLVNWCKGCFRDGQIFSPEEQAEALVTEVRTYWDEWPEKGGTKRLHTLFLKMYGPPPVDPTAKWKEQYGPPDKEWSRNLVKTAAKTGNAKTDFKNEFHAKMIEAIEDCIYYTEGKGSAEISGKSKSDSDSRAVWDEGMRHCNENHPNEVAEVRARRLNGGD